MFNISKLIKSTVTITTVLMLALGTGVSVAQDVPQAKIVAVDQATGRVVEASKLLSEMSDEEKAAYTEEDLKILEAHEAELKKMTDKLKY